MACQAADKRQAGKTLSVCPEVGRGLPACCPATMYMQARPVHATFKGSPSLPRLLYGQRICNLSLLVYGLGQTLLTKLLPELTKAIKELGLLERKALLVSRTLTSAICYL